MRGALGWERRANLRTTNKARSHTHTQAQATQPLHRGPSTPIPTAFQQVTAQSLGCDKSNVVLRGPLCARGPPRERRRRRGTRSPTWGGDASGAKRRAATVHGGGRNRRCRRVPRHGGQRREVRLRHGGARLQTHRQIPPARNVRPSDGGHRVGGKAIGGTERYRRCHRRHPCGSAVDAAVDAARRAGHGGGGADSGAGGWRNAGGGAGTCSNGRRRCLRNHRWGLGSR